MQKYYRAKPDADGDYQSSKGVRYTIKATDPARVHIPKGREKDMVKFPSLKGFLSASGLSKVK